MKHPEKYPEIFPRKRFGQHFLVSPGAADIIVDHAVIVPDDIVVEIGPGQGILSEIIVKRAKKTILIEKDARLVSFLKEEFREQLGEETVEIIDADAVFVDFKGLTGGKNFKVVSNLPYNVSIPVLFNLYKYRDIISTMTLMFQKEVADKIIASGGEKNFGVLSINAQRHADIYEILELGPEDFFPPPKVHSKVLNFNFLNKPLIHVEDEEFFQAVLKALFSGKRKKVINSMVSSGFFKSTDLKKMFMQLNIDSSKRPEDLTFSELGSIYKYLYSLSLKTNLKITGENR